MTTTARPLAPALPETPAQRRPAAGEARPRPAVARPPACAQPLPSRTAAARGAGRTKTPRADPTRQPAYAHLDITALRALRAALSDEEGKVSYWRRILQARIDVLEAGAGGRPALDHQHLAPVLTTERVTAGRRALIRVLPVDDIPPLPSLAELWDRDATGDEPARVALVADLRAAERQLSDYRTALHARISEVTTDLIARYRDDPALCLAALPTSGTRHRDG